MLYYINISVYWPTSLLCFEFYFSFKLGLFCFFLYFLFFFFLGANVFLTVYLLICLFHWFALKFVCFFFFPTFKSFASVLCMRGGLGATVRDTQAPSQPWEHIVPVEPFGCGGLSDDQSFTQELPHCYQNIAQFWSCWANGWWFWWVDLYQVCGLHIVLMVVLQ